MGSNVTSLQPVVSSLALSRRFSVVKPLYAFSPRSPLLNLCHVSPLHSLSQFQRRPLPPRASSSSIPPRRNAPPTSQNPTRGKGKAADLKGERQRVTLLEHGPGSLDEWSKEWLQRDGERKAQSVRDRKSYKDRDGVASRAKGDPSSAHRQLANTPSGKTRELPWYANEWNSDGSGPSQGAVSPATVKPGARSRSPVATSAPGERRDLRGSGRSERGEGERRGKGEEREVQVRRQKGGESQKRSNSKKDLKTESVSRNLSSSNVLQESTPSLQPPTPAPPPSPPFPTAPAWTERDAAAVAKAQRRAEVPLARVTGTPSKTAGSDVLLGRSLEELETVIQDLGFEKYRAKQVHQFMYKNRGVDFSELQTIPKEMRSVMTEKGFRIGRSLVHHVAAAADGTAKILLLLEDNRVVEAVGIPSEGETKGGHRLTACISSQVGCPLRCSFCATGKGGFSRNLKPHEIVGQVLALEDLFQQRVSNVVFMGMGEPMLNLPSVLAAVKSLNRDVGIGQRNMTISTVGVPNTIARLAEHRLQCTLAVSLHAPNQAMRAKLVPSASAYPMHALLNDCAEYLEKTGRRISFEYTLLAGINDQKEHAAELATTLRRHKLAHHVNVIPYNPVEGGEFRRPSKAYVTDFVRELQRRSVQVTVRQTRGMEANAACGQLRNEFQKEPLDMAVELSK